MANKTEYSFERELTEAFDTVLNDARFAHLKPILDEEIKILPTFEIRTDKEGANLEAKWPPAKVVKVKELFRLYMKEKPHFLLVMDYSYWEDASPQHREAAIHQALCAVCVESNAEGDVRLTLQKPEFAVYKLNVKYYGGGWIPDSSDAIDFLSVSKKLRDNSAKLLPKESSEPEPEPEPENTEPEAEATEPEPPVRRRGRSLPPPKPESAGE